MREPPAYPHVYEFGRLTEECVPNEVEYVEGHPYMMMVHKDKYQDVYDHCTPFNEYMLFQQFGAVLTIFQTFIDYILDMF